MNSFNDAPQVTNEVYLQIQDSCNPNMKGLGFLFKDLGFRHSGNSIGNSGEVEFKLWNLFSYSGPAFMHLQKDTRKAF